MLGHLFTVQGIVCVCLFQHWNGSNKKYEKGTISNSASYDFLTYLARVGRGEILSFYWVNMQRLNNRKNTSLWELATKLQISFAVEFISTSLSLSLR